MAAEMEGFIDNLYDVQIEFIRNIDCILSCDICPVVIYRILVSLSLNEILDW